MSIEVTPGMRLKDLIEKKGYKMKTFARMSGIVPNTLSKFVNGKPMSNKYIQKAAELLDVSPEYIKCETNDMTPPRYIEYTNKITQEARMASIQAYRFHRMEDFLNSLGLNFMWKARIGETGNPILLLGDNCWYPIEGKAEPWMEEEGIDNIQFTKLLYTPGSKLWIEITFHDRKLNMEYTEFQTWMKSLVASMEIRVQDKFDLYYDVAMKVEDTDYNRALRGEDRIKETDIDTYDLYGQQPEREKKNKNKSQLTDEEKLLEKVFGKNKKYAD